MGIALAINSVMIVFRNSLFSSFALSLLLSPLLILGYSGCSRGAGAISHLDSASIDRQVLEDIGDKANLTFPEGSIGLFFAERKNAMDPSFATKISIPKDSQANFLAQLETLQSSRGGIIGSLNEEVSWWSPQKEFTLSEKMYLSSKGGGVYFVLCEEGDSLALYLEWMKM